MIENWQISLSPQAEKFIKKLKLRDVTERILKGISELQNGPFSLPYKKLQGVDTMYRIRIGDYRVTYEVSENLRLIKILEIGHRQNIYE